MNSKPNITVIFSRLSCILDIIAIHYITFINCLGYVFIFGVGLQVKVVKTTALVKLILRLYFSYFAEII